MPELLIWVFGGAVALILLLAVLFIVLGGLRPSKGGSSKFGPGTRSRGTNSHFN